MEQSNSKPTDAPKPWDFAPGSFESRAAARATLEDTEDVFRINIVYIGHDPSKPLPKSERNILHTASFSMAEKPACPVCCTPYRIVEARGNGQALCAAACLVDHEAG